MDFNQLKDLKSTWGENRTIVPEWVEGQSFYVVSDELLKQFINEMNESRLLREQIAGEIKELAPKLLARWIEAGDPWVENWNYLDEENAQRIVEFIAAAIARGNE